LFLGLSDGAPVFARDLVDWLPEPDQAPDGASFLDRTEQCHPMIAPPARFVELRAAMARLPGADAELVATAKGIFAWHAAHGFCAGCGVQSRMVMSGWQRLCPACGAAHFPRTDPVVIMLVVDRKGDRCLLGHEARFSKEPRMYSTLAGFIEPGEDVEHAVQREVFEEAGIEVGEVRFHSTQPWAFPHSLMIGCIGFAKSTEIKIDPAEIEEALWFSKADVRLMLDGKHPKNWWVPGKQAIARALIQAFADGLDRTS
jgi:NAD+ diphosphatase